MANKGTVYYIDYLTGRIIFWAAVFLLMKKLTKVIPDKTPQLQLNPNR
jgi:hypothetical protein